MPTTTAQLCITDKTNKKFYKVLCSQQYKSSEHRNLQRHLDNAKQYPDAYTFLDVETAHIIEY
jgi:hypothetical protein